MRLFKGISGLIGALWLGTPVAAETLTWFEVESPPGYISSGPFAHQGFSDLEMPILFAALPEFDHRIEQVDTARLLHELEKREGACVMTLFRTAEREKIFAYADRPFLYPGFRLVIQARNRKKFRPFLTADGEIDLDKLAASATLSGSYVRARHYQQPIDSFMSSPDRRAAMEPMTEMVQVFNLVKRGRRDFGFMLGPEIAYFSQTDASGAEMTGLPIKGVSRFVKSYIACSRGEAARAALDKLNGWMANDRHWATLLEPMRRWVALSDFQAALEAKP